MADGKMARAGAGPKFKIDASRRVLFGLLHPSFLYTKRPDASCLKKCRLRQPWTSLRPRWTMFRWTMAPMRDNRYPTHPRPTHFSSQGRLPQQWGRRVGALRLHAKSMKMRALKSAGAQEVRCAGIGSGSGWSDIGTAEIFVRPDPPSIPG